MSKQTSAKAKEEREKAERYIAWLKERTTVAHSCRESEK